VRHVGHHALHGPVSRVGYDVDRIAVSASVDRCGCSGRCGHLLGFLTASGADARSAQQRLDTRVIQLHLWPWHQPSTTFSSTTVPPLSDPYGDCQSAGMPWMSYRAPRTRTWSSSVRSG